MALNISPATSDKLLQKHQVDAKEVEECFYNKVAGELTDDREQHRTDPPTRWFIAETNKGRLLKVCYVQIGDVIHIKTAYEPNDTEIYIYSQKG